MLKLTCKGELLLEAHRSADFKLLRRVCSSYAHLLYKDTEYTGKELLNLMREHNAPTVEQDFVESYIQAFRF